MDAGRALILQGDALALPLPDASVDLIVTSPPYFALRAYDAGPAQIGSEPTPAEYLEALWAATAEMVRVLKPSGSIFVDLGDKYVNLSVPGNRDSLPAGGRPGTPPMEGHRSAKQVRRFKAPDGGIPAKSLMLLPERYRIGCVDQLGLIARAVIVWNKPNGLPESVTDRVQRRHEDWVHLTRQPRYYSTIDEVREAYESKPQRRFSPMIQGKPRGAPDGTPPQSGYAPVWDEPKAGDNPLGKLPGSVWTIPSEPLRLPDHLGVQHYAAFPSEWPRRLILGWSPPGICLECGQGRVPVVERGGIDPELLARRGGHADLSYSLANHHGGDPTKRGIGLNVSGKERLEHSTPTMILGYACPCAPTTLDAEKHEDFCSGRADYKDCAAYTDCSCRCHLTPTPAREYHMDGWRAPPTRPAIVLDPFGGTGTTAMVARALGRIGVSVDLSRPYCRAARWRVHHNAGKAISRTNLERQGSLL